MYHRKIYIKIYTFGLKGFLDVVQAMFDGKYATADDGSLWDRVSCSLVEVNRRFGGAASIIRARSYNGGSMHV